MFENETRGWHGSYSQAGRISAERYPMILNKDKIVNDKGPRVIVKDFFSQEDNPNIGTELHNRGPDIFAEESKKKIINTYVKTEPDASYRIHKKNSRPLYTLMTPSCTKYNPKTDYIWKRTITGPQWEKVKGRPSQSHNKSNDPGFYLAHQPLEPLGKIFIDMKMQTMRGPFRSTQDVRYRTDLPFVDTFITKVDKVKTHPVTTEPNANDTKMNITFYDNTVQSTNENSSNIKSVPVEKSKSNPKPKKINKVSQYNGFISRAPQKNSQSRNNLIKGPDFKKTISRAYLNYLNRDKSGVAPFFTPSYAYTSSRTLTMVKYDQSIHPKERNEGLRNKGIDPSITFDPDKVINKVNNHFVPSAPDFTMMTSRPNDKSPLPFYMQQTCDRNSFYITSAKTLKMNNYANGKFSSNYNTFWPKKSFNKIVNMNLLTSDKFVDRAMNMTGGLYANSNLEAPINKAMKFYRKNFDDAQTGEILSRFDNVTFKSIPKKHNITAKEKKRFEIDYHHD